MTSTVLVCGTNYGHRYLQAVRSQPERYRLAGILARGSLRSILRAAEYAVPLFSSIDEITVKIDAAFAAMDPSGNDAVLELLRRGAAVLCEHPVRSAFLAEALEAADRSGSPFHVNAHFALLDAPRAFIEHFRQRERPLFLEATLTPRLLYALLDILRHAAGPLQPLAFGALEADGERRYRAATGTLAGIPTALRFERIAPDGSAENIVDARVAAYFPNGILTLVSIVGPVIWTANARRSGGSMAETLFSQEGITREAFDEQRLGAIRRSMAALFDRELPADQTPEHLLDVSRAAEELRAQLGP